MAKYHFLGGAGLGLEDLPLDERVAACVRIKASFVSADERESASGTRALLNYGHTLAHALETVGRYDLRHGEAVAVGLVFAARLAQRLERIDAERVQYHQDVLAAYGLPGRLPDRVDHDELVRVMARDKKAVDGLTFVLDGPGGVEIVPGVPESDVRLALESM
jgi:5-deoxy-5-amino-3-dehydroquinate synthase